jgi:hypothetical protein
LEAACSLAKLPTYRTQGTALLSQFANDSTFGRHARSLAAQVLSDLTD